MSVRLESYSSCLAYPPAQLHPLRAAPHHLAGLRQALLKMGHLADTGALMRCSFEETDEILMEAATIAAESQKPLCLARWRLPDREPLPSLTISTCSRMQLWIIDHDPLSREAQDDGSLVLKMHSPAGESSAGNFSWKQLQPVAPLSISACSRIFEEAAESLVESGLREGLLGPESSWGQST